MNSKIYFGFNIILNRIKSILLSIYYKIWGLNIGKKTKFYKRILIYGYANKIFIGNNVTFDYNVKLLVNKEGMIKINDNTLISSNVNINAGKSNVLIGENSMIAANTFIINNDHDVFGELSVRNSGHITKDIVIGDNVWIGANCTVLKGVTIGEGAIIGAASVVTKDVKPYSINIGSPSKFIKYRFEKDELIRKLELEGYNKSRIDKLLDNMY